MHISSVVSPAAHVELGKPIYSLCYILYYLLFFLRICHSLSSYTEPILLRHPRRMGGRWGLGVMVEQTACPTSTLQVQFALNSINLGRAWYSLNGAVKVIYGSSRINICVLILSTKSTGGCWELLTCENFFMHRRSYSNI